MGCRVYLKKKKKTSRCSQVRKIETKTQMVACGPRQKGRGKHTDGGAGDEAEQQRHDKAMKRS